jgi:hypothetical protein
MVQTSPKGRQNMHRELAHHQLVFKIHLPWMQRRNQAADIVLLNRSSKSNFSLATTL